MTDPTWFMVVPVLDERRGRRFLSSLAPEYHQHVAMVENSSSRMVLPAVGHKWVCRSNAGVARSWNYGRRLVLEQGLDMLWVASSSLVFLDGGRSLVGQMHKVDEYGLEVAGQGWHLVGFTRHTLETVGEFDEHFYPGYFEDTDFLYRMGLAGLPSGRENGRHMPYIEVDVVCEGDGVSVIDHQVRVDFGWLERYYVRKWGGTQGNETFRTPFDTGRHWTWWP